MKKIIGILLLLAISSMGIAQPVQWQFSIKKIDKDTYSWTAKATISGNWHLYSQHTPEGGPIPTSILFTKSPLIELTEKVKEVGKLVTKREEVFDMDVKYFEGSVEFVQNFKLKRKVKTNITGTIEYMVCNDKECLPPKKQSFSLAVD